MFSKINTHLVIRPILCSMVLFLVSCASIPRSAVKGDTFISTVISEGGSITPILNAPVIEARVRTTFPQTLQTRPRISTNILPGDRIRITLFEGGGADLTTSLQNGIATVETLVQSNDTITVPFAGTILVSNKNTAQIEQAISDRLSGKFVDAQVVVSILEQDRGRVTLIGANNSNINAENSHLLDALAEFELDQETMYSAQVVLVRDDTIHSLMLDDVLNVPSNNIVLAAGDSIYLKNSPQYATVIGAVNHQERVALDGRDLSILDLVAESDGFDDRLANPSMVFLIRPNLDGRLTNASSNKVFLIDMTSPADIAAAVRFTVIDGDVLYVPSAGFVDVQKVLASFSGAAALTAPVVR